MRMMLHLTGFKERNTADGRKNVLLYVARSVDAVSGSGGRETRRHLLIEDLGTGCGAADLGGFEVRAG